jgi:hypothetical protein
MVLADRDELRYIETWGACSFNRISTEGASIGKRLGPVLSMMISNVVVPAGVTALALVPLLLVRSARASETWQDKTVALALGLGFLAGYVAVLGLPPFPPRDAVGRLFAVEWLGLIAGLLLATTGMRRPIAGAVAVIIGVVLMVYLVKPATIISDSSNLWKFVLAAGPAFLLISLALYVAGEYERPTGLFGGLTPIALVTAIVMMASGNAKLAQLSGVLTSCLAVLALAPLALPLRTTRVATLAVISVTCAGLWLVGTTFGGVPVWVPLLLAGSAIFLMPALKAWDDPERRLLRIGLPIIAMAACLALALGTALLAQSNTGYE